MPVIDSWAIHSSQSLQKMSEEVKQWNDGVTGALPTAEQGSAPRLSFTLSLTCISLEKTGHFISVQHSLLFIEADWDAAKEAQF